MPRQLRPGAHQALWPQAFLVRALKPAVCLQEPLLLGLSSLPFTSLQMPKCTAAASTRHSGHCLLLLKAFKPAVCQPSGHCPLLLGRSRLPFIRQMPKMSRGSFDQALWPQAFVVRALKPAVCLHGPLLLGRSSLPFASPQKPKMSRGSFDPALWPQAYVVRALKPSVCLHGPPL